MSRLIDSVTLIASTAGSAVACARLSSRSRPAIRRGSPLLGPGAVSVGDEGAHEAGGADSGGSVDHHEVEVGLGGVDELLVGVTGLPVKDD